MKTKNNWKHLSDCFTCNFGFFGRNFAKMFWPFEGFLFVRFCNWFVDVISYLFCGFQICSLRLGSTVHCIYAFSLPKTLAKTLAKKDLGPLEILFNVLHLIDVLCTWTSLHTVYPVNQLVRIHICLSKPFKMVAFGTVLGIRIVNMKLWGTPRDPNTVKMGLWGTTLSVQGDHNDIFGFLGVSLVTNSSTGLSGYKSSEIIP